jgi:hypothetical protein
VEALRKEEYQTIAEESGAPTRDDLDRYHHSHRSGPSAYSVCMHREEAGTMRLTHIVAGLSSIEVRYKAGPPCSTEFDAAVTIAI